MVNAGDGTQMSLLAAPEETSPAVEALENLDPDPDATPALEWDLSAEKVYVTGKQTR